MSATRTPREGCDWTGERCEQLVTLIRLLNSVSLLNHSTNFIGNVQRCIELADELRSWKMDAPSAGFLDFLRDQAIKDRFPGEQS
jgi:hypothetical protein